MKPSRPRFPTPPMIPVLLAGALLLGGPPGSAAGQDAMASTAITADLLADIEGVAEKYLALAEAMEAHYDWRPEEGVRSVGEVFGHIVSANQYFPMVAGTEPQERFRGADQQETMGLIFGVERTVTDPGEIRALLGSSFDHMKAAVAGVPPERLDETVSFIGREATVQAMLVLMTTHLHEHLGQSIAYARMNGVLPPWSQ